MAGGRPSKYYSNVEPKLLLIEAWARDGLTIEDIANNLGVAAGTMYEYQKQYPELYEALKRNRESADIIVENALYKRALGYQYEEVTYENGMETKRVVKEVQPDTTAQIFWLKNRKPKEWRDKQDIEHSGGVVQTVNHNLKKLSAKELADLEHIIAKTADPG
jgi:IS30 family transposase